MKKFNKLYLFLSLIIICLIGVKTLHLDTDKQFLNIFAKYLFDEQYYVSNYPEVKDQALPPFEHFSSSGWREGKNPNKQFNTDFYKNFNIRNNKYDLNPLQHYVRSKLLFKKTYLNPGELNKVDKLLEHPKYYLALVAIFRNEARFLREWIEFYRMLGVEHFYLFNHLSNDNFQEVLAPYVTEGIVDLYNVNEDPQTIERWNVLQCNKYSEIAAKVTNSVEWLIAVDTDEFLFPVTENNLRDLLKKYDEYASLSVNWRIFGSNKVKRIPDNKLLLETLVFAGESEDLHVKTIVKPRYVDKFTNPHFAILKPGYGQVTENFEYFYGPFAPRESRDIVRINHYWSRDYDFFKSTKLSRTHVVGKNLTDQEKKEKIDSLIKSDENASSKYDSSILRFVPDLKARLFETKTSAGSNRPLLLHLHSFIPFLQSFNTSLNRNLVAKA